MGFTDSETKGSTLEVSKESRSKFAADGSPRQFRGVTVICHLRDDKSNHTIHRSIVENCYDVTKHAVLSNYVQLPKESLHMTILDTKTYDKPSDAVPEAEQSKKNEQIAAELIQFRQNFTADAVRTELQKSLPIKMNIDLSTHRLPKHGGTLKVPLKPFDDEEGRKLDLIRNVLRSVFGMSPPTETYRFHISAYYALQPIQDEQLLSLQEHWYEAMKRISEAVPTFEIDRIELCAFDSMFHFEVQETIS